MDDMTKKLEDMLKKVEGKRLRNKYYDNAFKVKSVDELYDAGLAIGRYNALKEFQHWYLNDRVNSDIDDFDDDELCFGFPE